MSVADDDERYAAHGYLEAGYKVFGQALPANIYDALVDYTINHHEHGGFVMALLRNDLVDAINRADESSYRNLREIVQFMNMYMPASCWGSNEKVRAWIDEPKLKAVMKRLKGKS